MPSLRNAWVKIFLMIAAAMLPALSPAPATAAVKIVAIGASNTAGWGVGEANAYPAQLQAMLRAKGYDVHVLNAGRSFDTTTGMLNRLDGAVPSGTSIVIVQPGGNDTRFFGSKEQRARNLAEIQRRMSARHIQTVIFENTVVTAGHYQWDGIHFTRDGHKQAAAYLARQITPLLGAATAR
jgi:acyl-CoA thioesterase-1